MVFSAPSFVLFTDLLTGWVCAPGRRTITAMITVVDPAGRHGHDAYHRFARDGAWAMPGLWQVLAVYAITRFAPTGVVDLDADDTLFHKSGRQVAGAGVFRDAVRSTVRRVVYAVGLNLVVVTLRVTPPWGGQPIAVPVNVRLHKKNDSTTTVAHAAAMIAELAGWLPERHFHLCADGAYATLAGAGLPRTQVTSRIRRDAALYRPAPPRTGKRGRPATKGARPGWAAGRPWWPGSPRRPARGNGARPPWTCAGDLSSAWSWSVTCSGTPSTRTSWSAWSSSATRTVSNPTTSSSPPT